MANDVVHAEEKRLVAQFGDQRQFLFDHGTHRVRHASRPALTGAGFAQRAQMLAGAEAVRHQFLRVRSEEHTSELQSLMRISYAVFCLKKKKNTKVTYNRRMHTHRHTSS